MTRRGVATAAALATIAAAGQAALPPTAQRAREIAAVVAAAAPRLRDPIDVVRRLDASRYVVQAGVCRLAIRVIYLPVRGARTARPGPAPFDAIVEGGPVCR